MSLNKELEKSDIGRIVKFLRNRDYILEKELGQGGCGKTVLLYDDIIQEYFVCKKYCPLFDDNKDELFLNFIREIKLLHQIFHNNVVRVYNYYLYPKNTVGYILMEYINGNDIEEYLTMYPEKTNDIFMQVVEGFKYLGDNNILHRDIRTQNILVTNEGVVKIIDLGFGKQIQSQSDFGKSISLNWWCEPPLDFTMLTYNFSTEVYFIGKLFEKIIKDNHIEHFKYLAILNKMCQREPVDRMQDFSSIEKEIRRDVFLEIDFSFDEKQAYREFADNLCFVITKIQRGLKYYDDINKIKQQLIAIYQSIMLEIDVPDNLVITRCFLDGTYYYKKDFKIPVKCILNFIQLIKNSTHEKARIIIANLHTRFDTIQRYNPELNLDDVPF